MNEYLSGISEPRPTSVSLHPESDRRLLLEHITRLEHELSAKDKTLQVLVRHADANRSGDVGVPEKKVASAQTVPPGGDDMESPQLQLREALGELKRTQAKLLQAQKLEAIGQLAAGIAHEVNTPTQYVSDNVAFLQRAFQNLFGALEAARSVMEAARSGGAVSEALLRDADTALAKAKLPYLLKHVPRALDQSAEGLARISTIVLAMKEFSHPSGTERHPVNIHEAIESTVTIARNEWKYVATVELDFEQALPLVPLLRNEFNQVILNLVVNAAHAISDATRDGTTEKGRISIRTRRRDDSVEIRVSDTGGGIPERVRSRIFEPFFTTKPVGKGTGQGLAIAYSVIVDKHRGTITFESEEGIGTTFVINLPLSEDANSEREREERA